MSALSDPTTIIALAIFTVLGFAGLWLVIPRSWRLPRPPKTMPGDLKPDHLPDREIEPAHIWTEKAAPLVAQLKELRPDLAYLWGPRLADFLAVEARYRGTGKAIATDLRLRQTRVGLVLMEIPSISPLGVLLINDQNNEVAISLFEHLKLPYAEVHPRDPNAVAKALSLFGMEAPITAPAQKPAQSSKPLSAQATPAGPDSYVPEPRKPARPKSSGKGKATRSTQTPKPSKKPQAKPDTAKTGKPDPETIPLPLHTRGEEPEDMFASRPAEPEPSDPTSKRSSLPAAAHRTDIV